MYNKKVLIDSLKKLGSAKAPTQKKDMIIDPMGQWAHPGENTRIPSNNITMDNVPYPVYADPNVGPSRMMYPEQEYNFPGADYVDEYPMMRSGGNKSKHVVVKQSKIPGANKGLFSNQGFRKDQLIGLAHSNGQPVGDIGHMHNHSDNPNMYSVKQGNERYVYAKRDIEPGEELTTNYRLQPELEQPEDFMRNGGSILKKKQLGGLTRFIGQASKMMALPPITNTIANTAPSILNSFNSISQKLPTNLLDQGTRDLLNYPILDIVTGESNFRIPDVTKYLGDFEFKPFSDGWLARQSMMNMVAGPQWVPSKEDFYTDSEIADLVNKEIEYRNARNAFDEMNPENPAMSMFNAFIGDRSRDELFSNLFPNSYMPNFRSKFLSPKQSAFLNNAGLSNPTFTNKGMLNKSSLKSLTKGEDVLPRTYKELLDASKADTWLKTADPKMVVMEMRGGLGLKIEDINNATPEQLEKWRQQVVTKMYKQAVERWKKDTGTPLKGSDAYNQFFNRTGSRNQFGGSIDELPLQKKGGSAPKIPKKKNSKAYSRSLDATNRLFAEHPWFKKTKSRKNKIYDPNAKYYQDGGEQGCPEGYAFNPKTGECIEWNPTIWNTADAPTSFDPVADIIYINPNDRSEGMLDEEYNQMYQDQLEHEQFHRLQWLNDELKGQSKIPLRMPSTVDNRDHNGPYYYNRRQEEADYLQDYWKNMHPQEAKFIPDNIIYNNETTPAMYELPWTVEGEASNYEDAIYYGMPSFFPKRKKGGALPKAQDGTIWVENEDDPKYKDYLIRQGLYNYSNNPNFNLRSFAAISLESAIRNNNFNDFNNTYYDNLLSTLNKYKPSKDLTEDHRVFYDSLIDQNVGPYGSKVTYQTIPNDQLHTDPNYNNTYFWLKDLEKSNDFFKNYPPINWQKKQFYNSDPYIFNYANLGFPNSWTEPNTLLIEDQINRNELKKVYPNLTDAQIDKWIEKTRKEPDFVTRQITPEGHSNFADTYNHDNEYIADPNKKIFIDDRGRLGYLPEGITNDIRRDYDYIPTWGMPETVVKVLPPPIKIDRPKLEYKSSGELRELPELPELTETPLDLEAPQYILDDYKDKRLRLVTTPGKTKRKTHRGRIFRHGQKYKWHTYHSTKDLEFRKREVVKPMAALVQKLTGYDPKYFEGYYDEEDNYIPGELDYGNLTGDKIEFKGAASLKDYMNQQKYKKEYEEYQKKLDERYEQSKKKQEESKAFKKGGDLPKAQWGFTGLGKKRGLTTSPFDFRSSYGQSTDFYKNPNYNLTYTTPNLFKKIDVSANPLSFTIGRPYYTDEKRLTPPQLNINPIYSKDYFDPSLQSQYGPEYQQFLQDVSDYTNIPVSNLTSANVNQYNAAQNLAAVKPTYKKGIPLTANIEYNFLGNAFGDASTGPFSGSLSFGAGYAPESGFYGTMDSGLYGVFGRRKNNQKIKPYHYFNKGLTRQGDRAWIPRLNVFNAVVKQYPEYNDAQTQKILELYKEDIEQGTTKAQDFFADNIDQSSTDRYNVSLLSPELTFQVKPFEKIPGVLSLTAGLRNTLGGKDKAETTVGGQWTSRPYGNIRYSVPIEGAIDKLKDFNLPSVKKRNSYYDYVNENQQKNYTNETQSDNTFSIEGTSTNENTMQPNYDGEGVGKGPCPRGYERLCEECRCTKIKLRKSPLIDKRGIHPYIDGKYLQNGGITKLSPEEEIEFQKFYATLPENLQTDDATYDIRGYWDALGRPEEFDYTQPKEKDGYYHAFSINPNTGEYLKSPAHETFQHAVDEDRKIGYRPIPNVYGRNIATYNESISTPEQQSFLRNIEGPANYIETELTPEEIEQYAKGGYIVEDISVPSLTKAQGGLQVKNLINTAKNFARTTNIGTLGTLNTLAKTFAPVMINPARLPVLGSSIDKVGPFTGSPLNAVPFYGVKMEATPGTAFRKFGDTLDYVKFFEQLNPAHGPLLRMGKNQIMSEGNWAELNEPNEQYPGVFGAQFDTRVPGSDLSFKKIPKRNGVLVTDASGNLKPIIPLSEPGLSFHRRLPFSNRYIPVDMDKLRNNEFDWRTVGGNTQSLLERYGYAAGYAAIIGAMGLSTPQEYLDEYINEPIMKGYNKYIKPGAETIYNTLKPKRYRQTEYGTIEEYSEGGEFELGDEVDEATMEELKKLGFTFEEL